MPVHRKSLLATQAVCAAIVCLLICLGTAFAESLAFKIYTTESGLAHDRVNKIVRDSRGFLWFCTAEGLSRFDGSRFSNFTQDDGLPHRNITDFLETRDGTYLIATSAGLVIFDPKGKAYRWNVIDARLEQDSSEPPMFRTFTPDTNNRQKRAILTLAEQPDGTLWAGTSYGLFRVDRREDGFRFEEVELEKGALAGIHSLLADNEGGLITVASTAVYRVIGNRVDLLDRTGAESILQAQDGTIWIGASGLASGLKVFELKDGKLNQLRHFTEKDGLLHDTFQYALSQLPNGRIIVGQATGFLEYLADAREGEPKFRKLGSDGVRSLAIDSADNLWIGTDDKGAWQLMKSGFARLGVKEGLSESEDIRSIFVGARGDIYLPTRPLRILRLNDDGKFEGVLPFGLKGRSWGWNLLDLEASDGEWWIPSSHGVLRYPKVSTFSDLARTPPRRIYTTDDGIQGPGVFILFEDSRGDIWIAADHSSMGPDTLSRWDRKRDAIVPYTTTDGLPAGSGPVSFAEDRLGNVWIGFYFGGLARFRDGRFELFTPGNGLPETMVGALFTDSGGRLWIGTSGFGLFRIDDPGAEVPVFKSISNQNGLSSNQVVCMTEDRFGQIYVGTGRGINRLDRQDNIEVFTEADGLPSNYVTRCATDKNGVLWFVSRSMVVRYSPEPKQPVPPPAVYVDKVAINGVAQRISMLGETDIKLPELSSDQTQFQIDFFALAFRSGQSHKYQYRLDDQEWSKPTDQQTLNLDLSPGDHVFAVRTVQADGTAAESPALVAFTILRPVWQRWWFVLLTTLAIAGLIGLVYRYRITHLREVNTALSEARSAEERLRRIGEERIAELEKVRSQIATDLHDDIGSSLTQIAVLSEVARAKAGRKGDSTPDSLQKISDVSNELLRTMSDIVWSINPTKDNLSDLTQRMRRFASDVLSAKHIAFKFQVTGSEDRFVLNTSVRREVFLIFKEAINNVIKHSEAKHVAIVIEQSPARLELTVDDDGVGLSDVGDNRQRSGNGLMSMRRRAHGLGGEIRIESSDGAGTSLRLTVPLIQDASLTPTHTGGERRMPGSYNGTGGAVGN